MTRSIRSLGLVCAAAILLPLGTAAAQTVTPTFGKGTKILDIGFIADDVSGFGAAFEFGLRELAPNLTLGVGATGSYQSESILSISYLAGTANVHYALPDLPKLDVFGGVALGITRVSLDTSELLGSNVSDSEFGLGIVGGARYAFTPKLAGTVRYRLNDDANLLLGIAFKF